MSPSITYARPLICLEAGISGGGRWSRSEFVGFGFDIEDFGKELRGPGLEARGFPGFLGAFMSPDLSIKKNTIIPATTSIKIAIVLSKLNSPDRNFEYDQMLSCVSQVTPLSLHQKNKISHFLFGIRRVGPHPRSNG